MSLKCNYIDSYFYFLIWKPTSLAFLILFYVLLDEILIILFDLGTL